MNHTYGLKKSCYVKCLVAIALAVFLYRLPSLVAKNFGSISVEQLLFHLTAEVDGTPLYLQKTLFSELVGKPLLAAILAFLVLRWFPYISRNIIKKFIYFLSTFLAISGVAAVAATVHIADAFSSLGRHSDGFDWASGWYRKPGVTSPSDKELRNLIWIYVESLESKRVPADSYLRELSVQHFSPREFQILPGTEWTLAGMIASQCGVPLMPVGRYGGNNFTEIGHPLKNATCIGDILKEKGYTNHFMAGADHHFAGKGTFLRKHGFTEVVGKAELSDLYSANEFPEDWWGFSDRTVFDFSRKKLLELAARPEPFFMNILTLDTHGPAGILTPGCRVMGANESIEDVFKCSIQELESFIRWVHTTGVMKNTVLVVSGDHPFMEPGSSPHKLDRLKNPFAPAKADQRDVFTLIMAPDRPAHQPDRMNHFDFFPTVLSAMNFELPEEAAGLGRNLYASPSLSLTEDVASLKGRLRGKSEGYLNLWKDPAP